MSVDDLDDLERTGDVLAGGGESRLKKLQGQAVFLSRLAQPRAGDGEEASGAGIRSSGWALCMELLAEQIGIALDEMASPALRYEPEALHASEATAAVVGDGAVAIGARARFGVTLAQVDELHRLIDMLLAHADVVMGSREAELAEHTLSSLGQAIFDGAQAVRGVVDDIEAQRPGGKAGVAEERAVYGVAGLRTMSDGDVVSWLRLPAGAPPGHAKQGAGLPSPRMGARMRRRASRMPGTWPGHDRTWRDGVPRPSMPTPVFG